MRHFFLVIVKKMAKSALATAAKAKVEKKMLSAPLVTPAEKKILVLLSALVEIFGVSGMQDFFSSSFKFSQTSYLMNLFYAHIR